MRSGEKLKRNYQYPNALGSNENGQDVNLWTIENAWKEFSGFCGRDHRGVNCRNDTDGPAQSTADYKSGLVTEYWRNFGGPF